MRKITLIILLLTTFLCGRAQDFLTPESHGIYYFYEKGDETLLQLLVTGDDIEGSTLRKAQETTYYLCAPSFFPEYALVIEKKQLILNMAQTSIWYALEAHKSTKEIPVNTMTMQVSEDICENISALFRLATMTATNLEDNLLGFDGTYYFFNHCQLGKLASVWEPENGRTARLVSMADSLCYAVRHKDTAVLNRQMELCKALTHEFKDHLPTSSTSYNDTSVDTSSMSNFSKRDCGDPEFPGGVDSLWAFIKANLHWPEGYDEMVDGTVWVEFAVEVDGSISEPEVLKSLTPELDAEAIRVVKLMPKFIWHSENCTVRRVYYNIPIKFRIE